MMKYKTGDSITFIHYSFHSIHPNGLISVSTSVITCGEVLYRFHEEGLPDEYEVVPHDPLNTMHKLVRTKDILGYSDGV